MNDVALHTIELCAGVGMLGEGLRAGLEHLGLASRVACYVEREAYAASQLVALMDAQCLDAAPIWSDLTTFDARAWRGRVDCITAGFPCQPHSVAGKRAGLTDERWIWNDIVRIIRDSEAWCVFLENVPGLATTGGLAACLASLAEMGFDAEWGCLSAAAVGASHKRERIFILGVRPGRGFRELRESPERHRLTHRSDAAMADPARHERSGQDWQARSGRGVCETGGALANAESRRGGFRLRDEQPRRSETESTGASVGDASSLRYERHPEKNTPGQDKGWIQKSLPRSHDMADAGCRRDDADQSIPVAERGAATSIGRYGDNLADRDGAHAQKGGGEP